MRAPVIDPAVIAAEADVPAEVTHWWGWFIAEPVKDDPKSIIYLDSRYEPTRSPSWPPGYIAPPLPITRGDRRKPNQKVPVRKRNVVRKSYQYARTCERLRQANIDFPDLFTHPIVIGARYQLFKVPIPTNIDLDLPNRRVENGIVYTYRRIDRHYRGIDKDDEKTPDQIEHSLLSNFRAARKISK